MSRRVKKRKLKKPRKASLAKRVEAARGVAESFNSLDPGEKRRWVDETLTRLVNMNQKDRQKLFSGFFKEGEPSVRDLETANQLITMFLHSVKPEFQLHYAFIIYKGLKQPIPRDLPKKLQELRSLKWLHAGLSPEVYDKLYALWTKFGVDDYDAFFNKLLSQQS